MRMPSYSLQRYKKAPSFFGVGLFVWHCLQQDSRFGCSKFLSTFVPICGHRRISRRAIKEAPKNVGVGDGSAVKA